MGINSGFKGLNDPSRSQSVKTIAGVTATRRKNFA